MSDRWALQRGADADLEACDWRPGCWYAQVCAEIDEPMVITVCPQCGGHGSIYRRWTIDAQGQVNPSIWCRRQIGPDRECGWHEYVVLTGWPEYLATRRASTT